MYEGHDSLILYKHGFLLGISCADSQSQTASFPFGSVLSGIISSIQIRDGSLYSKSNNADMLALRCDYLPICSFKVKVYVERLHGGTVISALISQ